MSDKDNTPPKAEPQKPIVSLPPQSSPQDTSNWDNRPFTTPTERIVIETYQGNDKTIIAE